MCNQPIFLFENVIRKGVSEFIKKSFLVNYCKIVLVSFTKFYFTKLSYVHDFLKVIDLIEFDKNQNSVNDTRVHLK